MILWNRRVFFQSTHSQAESRWTIFQKQEKVPYVVGMSPILMNVLMIRSRARNPHSESRHQQSRRAFLLLLLFKSWRRPSDLEHNGQGWSKASEAFEQECGENSNFKVLALTTRYRMSIRLRNLHESVRDRVTPHVWRGHARFRARLSLVDNGTVSG